MTTSPPKPRLNIHLKVALLTAFCWISAVGITALALLISGHGSWFLGMTIASVCAIIIAPLVSYYVFGLHLRVEVRERQLSEANARLEEALGQVRQLSGLLPICSSCKRIRNQDGSWDQLESYIETHSEADFTHSLCPHCYEKAMGQIAEIKGEYRQQNGR